MNKYIEKLCDKLLSIKRKSFDHFDTILLVEYPKDKLYPVVESFIRSEAKSLSEYVDKVILKPVDEFDDEIQVAHAKWIYGDTIISGEYWHLSGTCDNARISRYFYVNKDHE